MTSDPSPRPSPPAGALREVAVLFLKLGIIGFGGPAAHVALMRREVVERRRWVSETRFLDLLGATNLIPGPNSTELAIHLGYTRARWLGLVVAGSLFILPAALIVLAFAWAYVRWGAVPQVAWLFYGVKPAIVAVVAQALIGLGRRAVKGPGHAAVAIAVVALYFLGVHEIALLFGTGVLATLVAAARLRSTAPPATLLYGLPAPAFVGTVSAGVPYAAGTLFLTFLKIGAVLYGSGYVLLAFLRRDLVSRLGWLSDTQLLDAIAIGQFTPGPVLTTATFVGYVVAGAPGAALATVGIFLPSFVFVALSIPLLSRLRRSLWLGAALDGVNVAALALMAAVTWELGRAAVVDWSTALLAAASFLLLTRFGVNPAALLLGAGLLGLAYRLIADG